MGNWKRLLVMTAVLALLSPLASAYYFYIYFAGRGGPFTPVPERFDLTALQNNTVTYLISNQGPGPLMPGDTVQAIISQIHTAANVWNGVSTSSLKLGFGGLAPLTQQQQDATPEIDIEFNDNMPPGLIAQTRQTVSSNAGNLVAGGATFVPILYSTVQLRKDMSGDSLYPTSSYQDNFFLTVVHELGHAMGLQHTLTSSAMSTQVTRATTKAAPLTADDIAGLSLLYPAGGFRASTGSISGVVSLNGGGVNLASVVALSTSGTAISALTNPDGSYRIDGVPPGQYYLYVHPLPPAQQSEAYPDNVIPPQDTNANPFPPTTTFGTQFLGGTTDWTQTSPITVSAGNLTNGMNFNVSSRPGGPAVSAMSTYGFPNNSPAPIPTAALPSNTRAYVLFDANGILGSNGTSIAPGLNVSVVGGPAQIEANSLQYSQADPGYLQMIVDAYQVPGNTPTALAVTVNNDLYVLPWAFSVVPTGPPTVTGAFGSTDSQGNSTVKVQGSNLSSSTRIFFDGAAANVLNANADGSLTVAAPPAQAGYSAAVEALDPDSQTSLQPVGAIPPFFTYGGPAFPAISLNQSTIAAGTNALIEIRGFNTDFITGETVVGFGSSDITVEGLWVVNPGDLLLNVSVNPAAQPQSTSITVTSGIQLVTVTAAFQISPAIQGQMSMVTPILNQATQLAGVPSGGVAVVNTIGLPTTLNGWILTISNQPAPFVEAANGQLIVTVPSGMLPGPAVVQLISPNGNFIPPVILQVDPQPPVITGATNAFSVPISGSSPAAAGSTVLLTVSGLADSFGNPPAASTVNVTIGGLTQTATSVISEGVGGVCLVQVTVPFNLASGPEPVTVQVGTRLSPSYPIAIQ